MLKSQEFRTYSRAVSPGNWFMLAHPPGLGMEIQLCVEGDGTIDPSALSTAVAAASQACPGARLVRHGRLWVDSGRPPDVRVADAAGFDRTRLDSPLLRTPLTGTKGTPLCEVLLVLGAPTTIIFRAHHAVMDGRGAMIWQRQVFRALRNESVEGAASRLNDTDVIMEIAARLGAELPREPPWPGVEWRNPLGKVPSGPRGSMWRRRSIDGTHPAVTAMIAREVMTYAGGSGLVTIPVDLRQYLPGLRTTGTASGLVGVLVEEDDGWNDVHASLLKALSEHQYLSHPGKQALLRVPLPVLRAFYRRLDDKARKNTDFVRNRKICTTTAYVSHLGAVDLDSFCANGFEATSFYSLGAIPPFLPEVNIVESRGRTEVTVSWRDGPGVAERAETLLDRIEEMLSPRSRRTWDGNHTSRKTPPATLTRLFAEQVRRTPAAIAISSADGAMTYAELDERAGTVAAALHARAIGRDDRIGLVAGRSPAAVVAILGILKAGAAYVPIDASYPDARITRILGDARAPVCLLEPPCDQRDCLPADCAGISLATLLRSEPARWHDVPGLPDDLASVIYTSGSTGAPKGVEIEHRSLVNYVRWATREAGIDASTKMPLITSISFDMAGCAIFLPLLAGGTVLPVREVNAVTLRDVLAADGANAMAITPSHLDLINQAGVRNSAMRVVMTAGELLRRSTAVRAREVFGPRCRILCQWGPTETTIVNTSHEFDAETDTDAGIPFGRPMDNNAVYLLDAQGRFVAPGQPGEAYVAGVQLARGYLGRPDLTRQRFVHLADGTRVYRTGDLARLLPSGELAFISRVDDQVKVAGHRIEPAEVAQALERHPAVCQAAVLPRSRSGREDKELCGYVVCDSAVTPAELKAFLAGLLPRYMVPAAIVAVPAIPRTDSGKTDPRQLPDPFAGRAEGRAAVTGQDELAVAVAGIWARTLQVDARLLDDRADFHQLGGNSIMLLSMIREVSTSVVGHGQEEFMGELSQIICDPTLGRISELARDVRGRHAGTHGFRAAAIT